MIFVCKIMPLIRRENDNSKDLGGKKILRETTT